MTDQDRLDRLEADLIATGLGPTEARLVRDEVSAQLADDPTLSFGQATVAGIAAYQGVTVEEAEQAGRAYELYPAEVAAVVDEHFDDIAGQHGRGNQITVHDLQQAAQDESLPQEVRDAAYRLAADAVLFTNFDVAKQTDLSREPLGNGFNTAEADGIIGRDDVTLFPATNHRAGILLAWHPWSRPQPTATTSAGPTPMPEPMTSSPSSRTATSRPMSAWRCSTSTPNDTTSIWTFEKRWNRSWRSTRAGFGPVARQPSMSRADHR